MSEQNTVKMTELALSLVKSGNLPSAKALYKQLCQIDKNNAEAWIMLGAIDAELGDLAEAISCQQQAIALQPRSIKAHMHLAKAYLRTGKLEDARSSCQTALSLQPGHAAAWLLLARVHIQSGRHNEAESCCRKAIALKPDSPGVHFILGNALHDQKKLDECIESYREALKHNPGHKKAHHRLGMALYAQGRFDEAVASYRDALRIDPGQPTIHFNLGVALQEQKQLDAAAASYREALRLKPDYAKAHANLGYVLFSQGKTEEAVASYRHALKIEPDSAEIHYNLGLVLQEMDRLDEAVASFQMATKLKPDHVEAYDHLGSAFATQGRETEAARSYRRALEIAESDATRIKLAMLLPVIAESKEKIIEARRNLEKNISSLLERDLLIKDPLKEINQTNFYLVYHGENDRALQEKIGELFAKACPPLLYTAPHCRTASERTEGKKISVGFVSRHFSEHTIGIVMRGIIAQLSRESFTVTVFSFSQSRGETGEFIKQKADNWIDLPADLDAARISLAEQRLDVLIYTDIGMEPYTYFLAFSRLAPVQCVTWGHPVTTGIKNLDYFISCEDFEPENAQEHYSETLIRLSSQPTYYYRPTFPPAVTRAHYGLEEDKHLYLCQQTLFKFHPDFDEFLAGVLRADPQGQIVLISASRKHWTELLLSRFQRTIPDVMDRIKVLPYQNFSDYLNLLVVADIILDTIPFGGGSSAYQALAVGTPIVTLPGEYMRGRFTYACYQKMKLMECVAKDREDYVRIAVRLGTDKTYREQIKARILAASTALYEDREVVRELERFLKWAVAQGGGAQKGWKNYGDSREEPTRLKR